MTSINRWLDALGDRWARRVTFPGNAVQPPGSAATTEVTGEHVAEIARPVDEVWALVASPAGHFPEEDSFVLPGPGPERWCRVTNVAGGLLGSVVEVVEREEGRRIALRSVGRETTLLQEWAVFDAGPTPAGAASLVRASFTATVRSHAADGAARGLGRGAQRALMWVDHLLTGSPPPPPLTGASARESARIGEHRARGPLIRSEVTAQVVVPLPVEAVWRGVLDASTYTVDAAPGQRGGVVPGTPAGRPGELRFLVCTLDGLEVVRFHEVVTTGPGHRLVLRHHSASHPQESVTTVGAHPGGSVVRIVREIVHHGPSTQTDKAVRAAILAHLARLSEELVRRAGARPTDADG